MCKKNVLVSLFDVFFSMTTLNKKHTILPVSITSCYYDVGILIVNSGSLGMERCFVRTTGFFWSRFLNQYANLSHKKYVFLLFVSLLGDSYNYTDWQIGGKA